MLLAAAESNKGRGLIKFCQQLSVFMINDIVNDIVNGFFSGLEVILQFLLQVGFPWLGFRRATRNGNSEKIN